MSEEKYEIRERFRNAVLARDGHRCVLCGRNDRPLDVHHMIPRKLMPGGGYVVENGASLCGLPHDRGQPSCHERVEEMTRAILNGRTSYPEWAGPESIFKKIHSHWLLALAAAVKAAGESGE